MTRKLPRHIVEQYGSAREFRRTKRRQLRAAQAAIHELAIGSAFLPKEAYRATCALRATAENLGVMLRADTWDAVVGSGVREPMTHRETRSE